MKKFVTPILLSLLFLSSIASGEEIKPQDVFPGMAFSTPPANTVSCFDYYRFGSVEANISSNVSSTVSGTLIPFSGTLQNTNPYPIVDGTLYVKVFRDGTQNNGGNGPDVVDQFVVKTGISIPVNGSVPVSFSWQIPSYAKSGEYKIATYFITSEAFNLLGLSFTDDVMGNTVSFKVSGEQSAAVQFDKSGVTINGEQHHFVAFLPHVSKADPVTITASVENTSSNTVTAEISWQVSQWDAQQSKNIVQEEKSNVVIPAKSSKPVTLVIKNNQFPVYLVTGVLRWKDTKSIIGVRFVRDGIDRARINFPGVTTYPLKSGQESTLFSCLHNSGGAPSVPNGRLDLKLSDMSGNVIHEYSYKGDVTSAMMGIADKFVPQKTYSKFNLDAQLYSGDKLIDEAHIVYDCALIDPTLCSNDGMDVGGLLNYIGLVIALVIFLLVVWFIHKKIGKVGTLSIFGVLFLSAAFATPTYAESTSWSTNMSGYFTPGYMESTYNVWLDALYNPVITVGYNATAVNTATNQPVCNTSVPVGTDITLKFDPQKATDIVWHASGGAWDTPYGDWSPGAGYSASTYYTGNSSTNNYCTEPQSGSFSSNMWGNVYMYTPFRVNPSTKSVSGLGPNFTCNTTTPDANGKMTCKATAVGQGALSFDFSDTYGKFYFHTAAEHSVVDYYPGGCAGRLESEIYTTVPIYGPRGRQIGTRQVPTTTFGLGLVSPTEPMRWRQSPSDNLRNFGPYTSGDWGYVANAQGSMVWNGYNAPTVDRVDIPSQSISCPITVVDKENITPPTDPIVKSIGQCMTGQTHTISMKSTDPDGDQIRYSIDWDNNGSIDQTVPSTGYVSSGTEQTATRIYSTAGTKTVKIRAEDTSGNLSGWTTFTFSCDNGGDGGTCVAPSSSVNCIDGSCCASGACCWNGTCPIVAGDCPAHVRVCNPLITNCGDISVNLSKLIPSPPIVNKGSSCVIKWDKDVFNSYDKYTRCTFSTPTNSLTFAPSTATADQTSYTISDVQADTLVKMVCNEVRINADGTETAESGSTVKSEAVCRVNWSTREVN